MSLKYSQTTSDYLEWKDAMNLIRTLYRDGKFQMSLFVSIGCFGVESFRYIGSTLEGNFECGWILHYWEENGKNRTIRINPQLKRHISDCYQQIQPIGVNAPILISQKGTIFTVQRINVILKEIKIKYGLSVGNFSCHSLRKTFGRQVYNVNSDSAELALIKLMELFNHSSVAITKRYLGLRTEELLQTYDCLTF